LGWILTMRGGADAGLTYLESAGKALPDNYDVQYHLAFALDKTGKVDDARSILRKIVAQQSEFDSKADAKTLLAQLGG
jgi:thioredoxin-like negative regulator of GroEL